jgi:2'-5' RNA ligase
VDLADLLMLDDIFGAIKQIRGKVKAVAPGNVHLTMKFLGDIPVSMKDEIVDVMKESVEGVKPFELTFKGVGAFPKRTYVKVLWVGVEGAEGVEAMRTIASRLNNGMAELGFKKDKRGFSPHLTVARVQYIREKKGIDLIFKGFEDKEFGSVRIGNIKLKKSVLSPRGPTYSTVEEVALQE